MFPHLFAFVNHLLSLPAHTLCFDASFLVTERAVHGSERMARTLVREYPVYVEHQEIRTEFDTQRTTLLQRKTDTEKQTRKKLECMLWMCCAVMCDVM